LPTSSNPAHLTSSNAAHSTSSNPAQIYALDEVAFLERQACEAASLYKEAKRDRSYVAASKIFDRMEDLYRKLSAAKKAAADASGLDEAAFLERLEDEAAEMPDPHLEVYVREYLQRHRLELATKTGTEG